MALLFSIAKPTCPLATSWAFTTVFNPWWTLTYFAWKPLGMESARPPMKTASPGTSATTQRHAITWPLRSRAYSRVAPTTWPATSTPSPDATTDPASFQNPTSTSPRTLGLSTPHQTTNAPTMPLSSSSSSTQTGPRRTSSTTPNTPSLDSHNPMASGACAKTSSSSTEPQSPSASNGMAAPFPSIHRTTPGQEPTP